MQPLGHAATTVTYGPMTFEEWGRRNGDPYFQEGGRTYRITDHHHAPDGVRYQAYECDPREAVEWRLKQDAEAQQRKAEPPEAPAPVLAAPKPSDDADGARAAVEDPTTQAPAGDTASVANAATDAGEPPAPLPSTVAQAPPDLDRDVDVEQMTQSEPVAQKPSIPVPTPVEGQPGMVQRRTKGGRLKNPRPEHRHDDGRPPIRRWLRENGYPDLGENGPLPIKGKIAYYDKFGGVNAVSRVKPRE